MAIEWVNFSKSSQIWSIIGSTSRKFEKTLVIFVKILPKIKLIGIWMGYTFFFFENWYMEESTFKIPSSTSLPKPNLSTPSHSIYFWECINNLCAATYNLCPYSHWWSGQTCSCCFSQTLFHLGNAVAVWDENTDMPYWESTSCILQQLSVSEIWKSVKIV